VARVSENGAPRPAARAITPQDEGSDSAVSTARLVTPMAEQVPELPGRTAEGDWASFGTAPTLLLAPLRPISGENGIASTVGTAPTALEEQPWFKTGTTVPPPSMRPMAESVAPPAVRNVPNPRVLKIVAGVIAGCLFIVAMAGVKVLYLRLRGPVAVPAPTAESAGLVAQAVVDPASVAPALPEHTKSNLGEAPPPAAAPTGATPSPATPVTRVAPARSNPAPARAPTKPATRRVPAPKKVSKSR